MLWQAAKEYCAAALVGTRTWNASPSDIIDVRSAGGTSTPIEMGGSGKWKVVGRKRW